MAAGCKILVKMGNCSKKNNETWPSDAKFCAKRPPRRDFAQNLPSEAKISPKFGSRRRNFGKNWQYYGKFFPNGRPVDQSGRAKRNKGTVLWKCGDFDIHQELARFWWSQFVRKCPDFLKIEHLRVTFKHMRL